jgi:transcriptional regulator with XRE-family HTH domain
MHVQSPHRIPLPMRCLFWSIGAPAQEVRMVVDLSPGRWIKTRRESLALTQEQLAEQIGCAVETIRSIESGRRRPSPRIAQQLALHLKISSEEYESFIRWVRGLPLHPDWRVPPTPEDSGTDSLGSQRIAGDEPSGGMTEQYLDAIARAYRFLLAHRDAEEALSRPNAHYRRNRRRMLEKVQTFWIEGMLKSSLHGAALIALGMEHQPEVVVHPWNMIVQQSNLPARPLPPGTSITEVFDDLDSQLLILGAPGSGKTTLLLELTRELIARAETDETTPMPVVFNLSSWAARRRLLADWLADELNERYDVPYNIAQAWVAADALLLLLDGLDEVTQEHRAACVEAINAFRRHHGLVDLVVCSRVAGYETLASRLRLRGAVLVQPLSQQQIDAYLMNAGDQLATLRLALLDDPILCELAESPLMLSVMTLVYEGVSVSALPTSGALEAHQRQLFAAYVERMFMRRGADVRYSRQQTIYWLAWLARAMTQPAQAIFFIERLQPDLLTTKTVRWQYGVLDRLGSALICGGCVGLGTWLLSGLVGVGGPGAPLTYGLISGLVAGFFGEASETSVRSPRSILRLIRNAILGGLSVGLIGGLVGGLVGGLPIAVGVGLIGGVIGGLAGTLAGAPSVGLRRIVVVETLGWSWRNALRSLPIGLGVGMTFGLGFRLLSGQMSALVIGLVAGLGGLTFTLVGGLVSDELEVQAVPNQGIRRSARSAILIGLVFGLVFGPLVGLLGGLAFGPRHGLLGGVGYGLTFALVGGLVYGGHACLAHLALRLVLWRGGMIPWNCARFLDYCAERIFLRKVGGGYLFVHRLLMEYFASLNSD